MAIATFLQSGQIQGRQQLTPPPLARPRHFLGLSDTDEEVTAFSGYETFGDLTFGERTFADFWGRTFGDLTNGDQSNDIW